MSDIILPPSKLDKINNLLNHYGFCLSWKYDQYGYPVYDNESYLLLIELLPELENIIDHDNIYNTLPFEEEKELREFLKNNYNQEIEWLHTIQLKIIECYYKMEEILYNKLKDKIIFKKLTSRFQTGVLM